MYRIYTDSAADLPHEMFARYDIGAIPMDYLLNGESRTFDTSSPEHDAICAELYKAQRNGAEAHTSQITSARYVERWTPELEAGTDILYICFSSGMSATWQNAMMAAEQLREAFPERTLRVVDSLSATVGQGVLTIAAAINRENGLSLEDNARWIETHAPNLCHRFVAGDLDYLHKGGRVSGAVAVVGSMLNIKPMLVIDDEGKLKVVSKARGMKQAMKRMVDEYVQETGVLDVPKLVLISHSADPEGSVALKRMVEEVAEPGTLVETVCLSPIIGVHTGTQHLSVCGWGRRRVIE